MGKLEKQIMIGALALVGILVAVVILKGLSPRQDGSLELGAGYDPNPALMLDGVQPEPQPIDGEPAPARTTPWLDLAAEPEAAPGASEVPLGSGIDGLSPQPAPVFVPAPLEPAPPVAIVKDRYVIRDGDTLGHIAQRELGSAKRAREIKELNPGLDELNLVVGAEIKLPTGGAAPANKEEKPEAAPVDPQFLTHTVVAGDSLWALADKYLKDGNRFREIVAANPAVLKSENAVLPLGAKLRIPKQ